MRAALLAILLLSPMALAGLAGAASVDLHRAGGAVAFTFHGHSTDPAAATILESRGYHGTFYVPSGLLRSGPYYEDYVSGTEVQSLASRGHEVGSFGVTGRDLTTLDGATLQSELSSSRSALESLTGRSVRALAYPYGGTNGAVASATATYYASGRGLAWSTSAFLGSVDSYGVPALFVGQSTTLATAKGYVDFAVANGVLVVLAFDRITSTPGTYDWTPANLQALVDYAAGKSLPTLTMTQALGGGTSTTPPPAPPPPAPAGTGRVVLSFDDGLVSHRDVATTLDKYGYHGTFFVISGLLRQGKQGAYLSPKEVQSIAARGHDIESHTVSHLDLTTLGAAQLETELRDSQARLRELTGQPVRHLAYPYGSTSATVESATSRYYRTGRLFYDGPADAPATAGNAYEQVGVGLTPQVTLAQANAAVDAAIDGNRTIVLVLHAISSSPRAYDWTPAQFTGLLDHLKARNANVVTYAQAFG